MWHDEIVREIRKFREEHASKFNYDPRKIYDDLKEKENNNSSKKVQFNPKKYLKPTGTSQV